MEEIPDGTVDIIVTSPPYWGQRLSDGVGIENDPRQFVTELVNICAVAATKLRDDGIMWINIGDAYNTPIRWREDDHKFSTLGADKTGLSPENSAYTKPRHRRNAYIDKTIPWLQYGNLLGTTYRLVLGLCDTGLLFRGEVVWKKTNPMPEGRCRRPHRQHEPIYLFSKTEKHQFSTVPPVGSVWEFPNEKIGGLKHFSRFPVELPRRCIEAFGRSGPDTVVFDPFSGSGTTGVAAMRAGCSYIGIEIDSEHAEASIERIRNEQKEVPRGTI